MQPKILFSLLAGLILAGLLVGCGGSATPAPTATSPSIPPPLSPTNTPQPSPTAAPTEIIAPPPTTPPTIPPEPTATPPPTAAPTQAPTAPPTVEASPTPAPTQASQTCEDEAEFVADVTIPDFTLFEPGEAFVKTWRIRNAGDCVWDGYTLVYAGGESMGAPISNEIPLTQSGENVDISVNMVAPQYGGQYYSDWMIARPDSSTFGFGHTQDDYIWTTINVQWDTPPATPGGGEGGGSSGTSSGGGGANDCGVTHNLDYDTQILTLINDVRAANGLSALTLSPALNAAALAHSTDMACADFVGHTGSDGSDWFDRVAAQGYANYNSARENVYVGNPTYGGDAAGAFEWWMNSQVHRDNILFQHVSEIGIAAVYYADSSFGGYYTVVFARP